MQNVRVRRIRSLARRRQPPCDRGRGELRQGLGSCIGAPEDLSELASIALVERHELRPSRERRDDVRSARIQGLKRLRDDGVLDALLRDDDHRRCGEPPLSQERERRVGEGSERSYLRAQVRDLAAQVARLGAEIVGLLLQLIDQSRLHERAPGQQAERE